MSIIERLGFDMYFKDRYLVDDLRGSENIKVLFILESPHISEIRDKLPATGTTGQIVSKVVLNENSLPFGKLFEEGDPSIEFFAVMNVLQIPMQLCAYDFRDQQRQELIKFNSLRSLNGTYNAGKHKAKIKESCENDLIITSIVQDFSSRLHNLMGNSQPKLVIPCGVVVQALFEKVHERMFDFGKVSIHSCGNHSYKVFCTYHPSPMSGNYQNESKWITEHRHIQILKREIGKGLRA